MAKTKAQKKEITDKLESAFKSAASTVFVHFKGVTVKEESELRRALRADGVKYTVAKKTLIGRALSALGHLPSPRLRQAGNHEVLPLVGEIAIAYNVAESTDSTAPARLIHAFGEKLKGKLTIVGGLFENALKGAVAMKEIATIPSMDVLRGMFANIINSPRTRFAIALSEVAKKKA